MLAQKNPLFINKKEYERKRSNLHGLKEGFEPEGALLLELLVVKRGRARLQERGHLEQARLSFHKTNF
jgi:hypothetical protein